MSMVLEWIAILSYPKSSLITSQWPKRILASPTWTNLKRQECHDHLIVGIAKVLSIITRCENHFDPLSFTTNHSNDILIKKRINDGCMEIQSVRLTYNAGENRRRKSTELDPGSSLWYPICWKTRTTATKSRCGGHQRIDSLQLGFAWMGLSTL